MRTATALLCMTALLCVGLGQAKGKIFSDDFEDYDLGSDIRGQNGWEANVDGFFIGELDGDYMLDGIGSAAPLDGQNGVWRSIDHSLFNKVVLNAKLRVLSVDEAGAQDLPRSHNSGIGFATAPGGRYDVVWFMNTNDSNTNWFFDGRSQGLDIGGPFTCCFDEVIDLSITLDKIAETAAASLTSSEGTFSYGPVAMAASAINSLNYLSLAIDSRTTGGAQILSIEVVPEPATLALSSLGLVALFYRRRRPPTS